MTAPKTADFWRDAYQLAKDIHEIEVRTLNGRIAELQEQLRAARAANRILGSAVRPPAVEEAEEEGEGKENPLRKANPVQWIMDSVEEVVPLGNENARQGLRSWVQRQIRLRGQGSIDDILNEAIQGDVSDEHEEEVEG